MSLAASVQPFVVVAVPNQSWPSRTHMITSEYARLPAFPRGPHNQTPGPTGTFTPSIQRRAEELRPTYSKPTFGRLPLPQHVGTFDHVDVDLVKSPKAWPWVDNGIYGTSLKQRES
jgi:hypothetical protein